VYKGHSVSVVVPCYNEENGIASTFEGMPSFVDEVVVVDNNCTDRTAEIAASLGGKVVCEGRQGYGAAYRTGFASAKGDVIVTMDGDGTYPRNFIPVLLDVLIDEGLDFITCDRTGHKSAGSGTATRVFGNWVLSVVQTILFGHRVADSQSGMWVFRRAILPLMDLTSDGMALSEEIKIEAFHHPQIKAAELPIYYRARVGESKLSVWKDGLRNLVFLFRKRWLMLGFVRRKQDSSQITSTASLDQDA
jgi:glycosyltransferase involved in cell wall biosynthesis